MSKRYRAFLSFFSSADDHQDVKEHPNDVDVQKYRGYDC